MCGFGKRPALSGGTKATKITAAPQARERAHLYASILAMRYIGHSKEGGRLEYARIVYAQSGARNYLGNATISFLVLLNLCPHSEQCCSIHCHVIHN